MKKQNKKKGLSKVFKWVLIARIYECRTRWQPTACLCVVEVLSNEALKPSKLRHHLEAKHGQYSSKPRDFFENKLREYQSCRKAIKSSYITGSENAKAVEVSSWVAKLIAQTRKPHTIREELILPSAKEMVGVMVGEKAAKQLDAISLSDNTVKRRIDNMAEDVLKQLVTRVQASRFYALQIDESTDIASLANLMAYVRYEYDGEVVHEDFLFCKPLPSQATAENIFDTLNEFMVSSEIDWAKCVGLSTDGARVMVRRLTGVVKRVKDVAPLVTAVHCSIHREALATKTMPADFKTVLEEAVRTVNFIKSRPLQSRLFAILCAEMGSDHRRQLLLHTEVRWLSRGEVLTRLFELRDEVRTFFVDSRFELSDRFCDFKWLCKLANLSDIFSYLNGLNLSLQGKTATMFQVYSKIKATIRKLELWDRRVGRKNYGSFDNLCDFVTKEKRQVPASVAGAIREHLKTLKMQLREYFPVLSKQHSWIQNPFAPQNEDAIAGLSSREQDSLVELSCDTALKLIFTQKHLAHFWMHVYPEYTDLSNKASKFLMPFTTTYLCETGFSALLALKTKYRNKLDVEPDHCLKLTSI